MSRTRRTLRIVVLGLVLAITALVVPPSAVRPAETALVRGERATGVDLSPEVIWILALGSDARPGQPLLRSRADAIQLVGINTRTGAATAIGIARDSYVAVPGYGTERINAALYFGGPRLMSRAVADMVGVEADYVFVSGFRDLERMVNSIGGITVDSKYAFSDPFLGGNGFREGRQRIRGRDAVAFSRIRKALPGGDFDRSANQQRTLRGIHARIRANADRPGFLEKGIVSVAANLDTSLPPSELFKIAQAVAQVEPGSISTCVVHGSTGLAGSASVVFPDVAQARSLGNRARKDATLNGC